METVSVDGGSDESRLGCLASTTSPSDAVIESFTFFVIIHLHSFASNSYETFSCPQLIWIDSVSILR